MCNKPRLTVLALLAVMTMVTSAVFAQPFGDQFARKDLGQYAENARLIRPDQASFEPLEGRQVLRLTKSASVTFKDVPIDPTVKYALTFRGRFEGDGEAIEENPHLDFLTAYRGVPSIFAGREVQFLDAEKRVLRSLSSALVFREWFEYRDVFYAPPKSKYVRLTIKSGREDQVYFVDNIQLQPAADEGAINCNPVPDRYGKYNYSGWQTLAVGAKMIELPDGRVAFDTKYGTSGATFPLAKPGKYTLTTISQENGFNYAVVLNFLDEEGKKISSINGWGNGKPYEAVLPAGATQGSLLFYSNVIEEVRVNYVGQ